MIRMCENGPFIAVELKGVAGGGGIPQITLLMGLAWRELRPCVDEVVSSLFFGQDTRFDVSLKKPSRRALDSRRRLLPPWPSTSGGGVIGFSFPRLAGVLLSLS